MSETVCDLANDAMRRQGRLAKPHWLNTIPEAMDDCDQSMTPRAREVENTQGRPRAVVHAMSQPQRHCDAGL